MSRISRGKRRSAVRDNWAEGFGVEAIFAFKKYSVRRIDLDVEYGIYFVKETARTMTMLYESCCLGTRNGLRNACSAEPLES